MTAHGRQVPDDELVSNRQEGPDPFVSSATAHVVWKPSGPIRRPFWQKGTVTTSATVGALERLWMQRDQASKRTICLVPNRVGGGKGRQAAFAASPGRPMHAGSIAHLTISHSSPRTIARARFRICKPITRD